MICQVFFAPIIDSATKHYATSGVDSENAYAGYRNAILSVFVILSFAMFIFFYVCCRVWATDIVFLLDGCSYVFVTNEFIRFSVL